MEQIFTNQIATIRCVAVGGTVPVVDAAKWA